MNNTTVQSQLALWQCRGFISSAVQTLWFGTAPNGHDMIAVKWRNSDTVYAYSYDGIIDTFMFYMESSNSVGFAISQSKLRHDFADYYLDDINTGQGLRYDKNLQWDVPSLKFGRHNTELSGNDPVELVNHLTESGVLSREESRFINYLCGKRR
jgi:hypothetical protein